jgi:hypothetical protein
VGKTKWSEIKRKKMKKIEKFCVLIAAALLVTSVALAVALAQPGPAPYPTPGVSPTPAPSPGAGAGPAPYPTPGVSPTPTPTPGAGAGPAPYPTPSPPPPKVEYRAVIAGEGFTCDWADNDAYDMYNRLLNYSNWKAENIRLLVSNAAGTKHDCTRDNIQAEIAWMASQADADDVCLFFYAGHGDYNTDIAPIDEADGWDEYICPEGGNIRDDELDAWMTTPIKGKKVVIIDSCFSGGFVKGEGARTIPGVPYAELTDGFVRDLNKPGYVTLTEPRAIDYTAAHYPAPQHPQLYDGVPGELPVVITK